MSNQFEIPEVVGSSVQKTGRTYRYSLERVWDSKKSKVVFVLLNPSTATISKDDQTTRKLLGFAARWGYGSYELINLFAYRATDPKKLLRAKDPIGLVNDSIIIDRCREGNDVVLGWGRHGSIKGRGAQVILMLREIKPTPSVFVFKHLDDGVPAHPLYLPYSNKPVPFEWSLTGY